MKAGCSAKPISSLFLYRYIIEPVLLLTVRVLAMFNPKTKRGLEGRKRWREQLKGYSIADKDAFRVHFHAASVGEFEQAKPIIEALRSDEHRAYRITASFFSVSGYDQQSKYSELDGVSYLPEDRRKEMSEFLDTIAPQLIIIIRYDLWFNFLHQASVRAIPVALACGTLRRDSVRFYPLLRMFFAKLYGFLWRICCVSEDDKIAFTELVPSVPVCCCGDSRYDRVADIVRNAATRLPAWFRKDSIGDRFVFVAGSVWQNDAMILREGITEHPSILTILVPHEPSTEHVDVLQKQFPDSITFTQLQSDPRLLSEATVIIVDRTGILSALYSVADCAYVGGGFGEGVHSVLEPAAYMLPVACGPNIKRSRDASALAAEGGLNVVRTANDAIYWLRKSLIPEIRIERSHLVEQFMSRHLGATQRILEELEMITDRQ